MSEPSARPGGPIPTILVVDDAANIRAMLGAYLEGEGYRVIGAGQGREALEILGREAVDLVILDLMMPLMDGPAFMRALPPGSSPPVIMLTARLEEDDKLAGFALGADDYVTKPFSLRELAARVQALLRRSATPVSPESPLRVAELELDRAGHAVRVAGRSVDLTPSELVLLEALMATPGRVWSRLALLERLHGNTHAGYERTIDVHVRNLRAKLEPDPARPRYIETVHGAGYRFAADGES